MQPTLTFKLEAVDGMDDGTNIVNVCVDCSFVFFRACAYIHTSSPFMRNCWASASNRRHDVFLLVSKPAQCTSLSFRKSAINITIAIVSIRFMRCIVLQSLCSLAHPICTKALTQGRLIIEPLPSAALKFTGLRRTQNFLGANFRLDAPEKFLRRPSRGCFFPGRSEFFVLFGLGTNKWQLGFGVTFVVRFQMFVVCSRQR